MRGLPVVSAEEMKRLEKDAFEAGESEQGFMERAGEGIASVLIANTNVAEEVLLLIGKGNNGGDAFVAGETLLKRGFSVTAYCLYPIEECSSLSQIMHRRFKKAGGKFTDVLTFPEEGIIVDGLVGTGFQGAAEGVLAETIDDVNDSGLPIFAIDIPSGLHVETGKVETSAIQADTTIFLGLPKIGFFLGEGWNHVGNLVHVDFGLPEKFVEDADPIAALLSEEEAAFSLPEIKRNRHKYEAGYVLAVAGSPGMPGAALMSCLATLKSGAGIVRLFYPEGMKDELATAPYELIKEGWDLKDDTRIFEEANRAKAFIIGPGIGRSKEMEAAVKTLLARITLPCILDADALYFLAEHKEMTLPEKVILTPHHQEMKRILGAEPTFERCQDFAKKKHLTIVLKGAPTVVFHPYSDPLIVAHGDPGMATAGTGDVLTGVIAAFVAQGLKMRDAAALGALLHGLAGEIAAEEETSYGVIATDLVHALSEAIHNLQSYL